MDTTRPLTSDQAADILRAATRVGPLLEGGVDRMKLLHQTCLDEGIPTALVRPSRPGGG